MLLPGIVNRVIVYQVSFYIFIEILAIYIIFMIKELLLIFLRFYAEY